MNVDLGVWDRLRTAVILLLFVACVLGVILWYRPLVDQNERMRQEIMFMQMRIQQEEERGKQMEAAIRALRTDPRAVERVAREKLGFIKPGETRIQFEPLMTNTPPVP
jgi:cell division protein FtsB